MAARVSARRSGVPLSTAQSMRTRGALRCSARRAPPQPISMSSQCAPRHRMRRAPDRMKSRIASRGPSASPARRVRRPGHPRALAAGVHAIKADLVLEGIHALPKAFPAERRQLAFGDQPCDRLLHQLLAFIAVVEDLLAQYAEAAIDPQLLLGHG